MSKNSVNVDKQAGSRCELDCRGVLLLVSALLHHYSRIQKVSRPLLFMLDESGFHSVDSGQTRPTPTKTEHS